MLSGLKFLSLRATFFHTYCFWRLTCIKGSFSTVILWRMVGFWMYAMERPSENRFDLLNRIREKRNILGYPENQPQFGFHFVYNSKGKKFMEITFSHSTLYPNSSYYCIWLLYPSVRKQQASLFWPRSETEDRFTSGLYFQTYLLNIWQVTIFTVTGEKEDLGYRGEQDMGPVP